MAQMFQRTINEHGVVPRLPPPAAEVHPWVRRGDFTPRYFGPIENLDLCWHFVDIIWVFLFPLSPYRTGSVDNHHAVSLRSWDGPAPVEFLEQM